MEIDNALRELRSIAEKLNRVCSIELNPQPEVLRKRISIYESELDRSLRLNRKLFGLSFNRGDSMVWNCCNLLKWEPRSIKGILTQRVIDTSNPNPEEWILGKREIEDGARKLALLQSYGEWLSSIVIRFANRIESDHKFYADPIGWHNDYKAGKLTIDPSSKIRMVTTGLSGARVAIERQEQQPQPQPQPAIYSKSEFNALPEEAERGLIHWIRWDIANKNAKEQGERITQPEYLSSDPVLRVNPPDLERGKKEYNNGWRIDGNDRPYLDRSLAQPKAKPKPRKRKTERRNSKFR